MPANPLPVPSTQTNPSLRAFLAALIDYAGLFPPASLSLGEAVGRYARYRAEPESWMLARFVIPARRLGELAPHAALFAHEPPFRFAALGTGGADGGAFLGALQEDLARITAFHKRYPQRVQVDVMEARLPAALLGADAATVRAFLDEVVRGAAASLPGLSLFFEVPLDEALRRRAPALLAAMAACNDAGAARVGFKMRTGGTEPDAFPAAEHLAYALTACRDAGVPFKATAGLHHPVRCFHASVQTRMYGFFNVFGAAVLAAAHPLDEAAVRAILLDEDADHFRFTPSTFAWQHLTASLEAIRRARATFACSVGSCSFDEPREDLQALGLL